jgi:hypothetical protein
MVLQRDVGQVELLCDMVQVGARSSLFGDSVNIVKR